MRVPITCKSSSMGTGNGTRSSGTHSSDLGLRNCQNCGDPISDRCQPADGTDPYTMLKDRQAPSSIVVKRELPRLPKEVKVKKLWDSVVISQIDDSAEAKSPMASIRVKV